MRTRKEILEETETHNWKGDSEDILIELLLDIRELLSYKSQSEKCGETE